MAKDNKEKFKPILESLKKLSAMLKDDDDNNNKNNNGDGDIDNTGNNEENNENESKNGKGEENSQNNEEDKQGEDKDKGNGNEQDEKNSKTKDNKGESGNNNDLSDLDKQLDEIENELDGNDNNGNNNKNGKGGNGKARITPDGQIEVDFRGSKVRFNPQLVSDILCNEDDKKKDEDLQEQTSDSNLDSIIRTAMNITNSNNSKQFGTGSMSMMRKMWEMEHIDAPNWDLLLKHYLRQSINKIKTRSRLNKGILSGRMSDDILLMGEKKEKNKIKNCLIAIDTSGSIDDKDLHYISAAIEAIFDSTKTGGRGKRLVEGHIAFWDYDIASCEPFKNFKELKRIKAAGGGGTNVNCVFKKAEELKSDIIIIFTDGYFGDINKEYMKLFNKTIWAIEKQNIPHLEADFKRQHLKCGNNIGMYQPKR